MKIETALRWMEVQHIKLKSEGWRAGQWGQKQQKIIRKPEKNPLTWGFVNYWCSLILIQKRKRAESDDTHTSITP